MQRRKKVHWEIFVLNLRMASSAAAQLLVCRKLPNGKYEIDLSVRETGTSNSDAPPLSVGEIKHLQVRHKQMLGFACKVLLCRMHKKIPPPFACAQSVPAKSLHSSFLKPRISSLNNFMRQRHKRSGRRGVAPQIMYTDRPDNPWKDRYLICGDCERRANYERLPPRKNCNNSTVIELDMTAPFSRDNCMVTSCEIVQMVKEDLWVLKDEHGRISPAPEKRAPAFPVQVLQLGEQ